MIFTPAELEYLASQPLGRLATVQPDGTLQVNPVGFAYNAEHGSIDIGGFVMSTSRKFRNVADNGRVAFVVDDIPSTDPWRVRCLDIRGVAEAIAEPDGRTKTDTSDPAIIRVFPRRIIGLGIEDPDLEPHQLVANARTLS
jgi:pyridoxamine 5'-phosphate oxidase family protein